MLKRWLPLFQFEFKHRNMLKVKVHLFVFVFVSSFPSLKLKKLKNSHEMLIHLHFGPDSWFKWDAMGIFLLTSGWFRLSLCLTVYDVSLTLAIALVKMLSNASEYC